MFRVQVFSRSPTIDDILGPDWRKGPTPLGAMTHQEFLNLVTPTDVRGYAAFDNKQVPKLESGAMDYMMSKTAYLTDEGEHNGPHLMFLTAGMDAKDWGSGAAGSPLISAPYWFFSSKEPSQMKGLPPILVFLIGVPNWSDGTTAASTMIE